MEIYHDQVYVVASKCSRIEAEANTATVYHITGACLCTAPTHIETVQLLLEWLSISIGPRREYSACTNHLKQQANIKLYQ
jgi:hypothetical protein